MQFFVDIFNIFKNYWNYLLLGVANTMLIALVGTVAGLLIGLLIGVLRTTPTPASPLLRVLRRAAIGIFAAYIEIFRGTPMMVQA